VHHSFPDPAKAEGTEEEIMNIFRAVRDEIEHETVHLLTTLDKTLHNET
jgi:hypothetical protein